MPPKPPTQPLPDLPTPLSPAALSPAEVAALAGYQAPDYLDRWQTSVDAPAIRALRAARLPGLAAAKLAPLRDALSALPQQTPSVVDLTAPAVTIGAAHELSPADQAHLDHAVQAFVPWKKGPYSLFGHSIDAEWRSDQKWDRVRAHITPLRGRRVADIGCHNGYFLFRMAAEQPELVVGFEPVLRHWLNFHLIQRYARCPQLHHEPLGVEHSDLFPGFFDTVFCMGILYHHTDPVGLLRKLRHSLAPGGELIIDCQGIPGGDSVALVPAGKYARSSGVWFLPTQACLMNWLNRAGLHTSTDACFYAAPLSTDEQRRTAHAPIASLAEALDPGDPQRTIEGYPAPWRFYVRAVRR